jgi:serine/threonine protein kinase
MERQTTPPDDSALPLPPSGNQAEVHNQGVETMFHSALEQPSGDRAAFVVKACGDDAELQQRVRQLLAAYERSEVLEGSLSSDLEAELARLMPENTGDIIGHYKLRERIGEGGFGVVWVADQEKPLKRRVALKIIKPGMDTADVIARFEQERQALAMMDHPNIARVFDAGATVHGRPYFVMELVRGVPITTYCDDNGLGMTERINLFIHVCQAVQHAHQKGIIHRDLKPSNILVTIVDGQVVPKIIDFGVAKATQGRLIDRTIYTQFQQMLGTPLYMSPEQAEMTSLDIDTRSDIYSLGVLLYELLTGSTPIDPISLHTLGMDEMRRLIREVDPPRPSVKVKTIPLDELTSAAKRRHVEPARLPSLLRGDLDVIVMKCLEKDRNRRYATTNDLSQDLHRHLNNEIVTARPPTSAYLIRRLIRRNRVAFLAGSAVLASLVLGLAVSIWQAFRAYNHANRAEAAEGKAVAALNELRATAPSFATQARMLADKEQFNEAIEKLNYAIKLRPDSIEYLLAKADLLQCQLRFEDAAEVYRAALEVAPGNERAQSNLDLCEALTTELKTKSRISRESLTNFLTHMAREHRSAAEMLPIGRVVGEEKKLILDTWRERLKDLPLEGGPPLEKRLELGDDGLLSLDLSYSPISDLSVLEGMPLGILNLQDCINVKDLRPLSRLPLRSLGLWNCSVADISPLSKIRTLTRLQLGESDVQDLSPLRGLPLERLELNSTAIQDISALDGMQLRFLALDGTLVNDLTPLSHSPLEHLNCRSIPARNFDAIARAPLRELYLSKTAVGDLAFLNGMPLRTLDLYGCVRARGFQVIPQLKNLESLTLPDSVFNLPRGDLMAIQQLRNHPGIRNMAIVFSNYDLPMRFRDFWEMWDVNLRCVLQLRDAGVKFVSELEDDGSLSVRINDPNLADLSILKGARISRLNLTSPKVRDITPLEELPLVLLELHEIPEVDVSILANLPLSTLVITHAKSVNTSALRRAPLCNTLKLLGLSYLELTDFAPVAACTNLSVFSATDTNLSSLEPLRGRKLASLFIARTNISDLSPLAGMPLETLYFDKTQVTDVSPLLECAKLSSILLPDSAMNVEVLHSLPRLRRISYSFDRSVDGPSMTALQFWQARKSDSGSLNPSTFEDSPGSRKN